LSLPGVRLFTWTILAVMLAVRLVQLVSRLGAIAPVCSSLLFAAERQEECRMDRRNAKTSIERCFDCNITWQVPTLLRGGAHPPRRRRVHECLRPGSRQAPGSDLLGDHRRRQGVQGEDDAQPLLLQRRVQDEPVHGRQEGVRHGRPGSRRPRQEALIQRVANAENTTLFFPKESCVWFWRGNEREMQGGKKEMEERVYIHGGGGRESYYNDTHRGGGCDAHSHIDRFSLSLTKLRHLLISLPRSL
jgi:hypothetical protein